jgi:predicted flap endonuclease-1-like 5' DNA nuclease
MAICTLIPVIVGLISAILGYWLGKLKSNGGDSSLSLKSSLDASNETNSKLTHKISLLENDIIVAKSTLQNDLDACKANTTKLNATILSLQNELGKGKSKTAKPATDKVAKTLVSTKKPATKKPAPAKKVTKAPVSKLGSFDANLAKEVYGKKIKVDDLKLVEGIGPKIEALYIKAGIKTWKALSETPLEKSQAILKAAGERYAIHNPGSWAKQALMASEGKWADLKAWQDAHKGGKE